MTERIVALLEQAEQKTPHAGECYAYRNIMWLNDAGPRPCICDWAQRVREKIARAVEAFRVAVLESYDSTWLSEAEAETTALAAFEGALLGGGER